MEEINYIKQYLKEIEQINNLTEDDNKNLVKQALSGDGDSKAKLIEGNLYIVPLRVSEFIDSSVNASDMIQEGNIALIEAVDALLDGEYEDVDNYTEYFSEMIDISLSAFVTEESEASLAANNMKNLANKLLDITTEFEKEHERTATLEELATLMGMDKDEVENILKTSYNAMELAADSDEGK